MNMKRAFPVMLAVALVVAIGAMVVFAAPGDEGRIDSLKPSVDVVSSPITRDFAQQSDSYSINLPDAMFNVTAGTSTQLIDSQVRSQLGQLEVIASSNKISGGASFSELFETPQFSVNTSNFSSYPVILTLTAKNRSWYSDSPYDFDLNIEFTSDGNTTTQSKTFALTAKVKQADGSLTGVNTATNAPPNYMNVNNGVAEAIKPIYTVNFNDSAGNNTTLEKFMFNYTGADNVITGKPDKLTHKNIEPKILSGATVSTGASFGIRYTNSKNGIEITAPVDAMEAGKIYVVNVGMEGDNFVGGKIFSLTLQVPSTSTYKFNKTNEDKSTTYSKLALGADKYQDFELPVTSRMLTLSSGTTAPKTKAEFEAAGFKPMVYNTGEVTTGLDVSLVDANSKVYIRVTGRTVGDYGNCDIRLVNDQFGPSDTDKYYVVAKRNISVNTSTSLKDAGNIDGIDTSYHLDDTVGKNGSELKDSESLTSLDIKPGDVMTFSFDTDYFTWSTGSKPYPPQQLTDSLLSNGKITVVKKSGGTNSDIIETPVIKHVSSTSGRQGYSYIEVKFREIFPSTKELDFSITLGLAHRGSLQSEVTLEGTIANEVITVGRGSTSVDISGGYVLEAEDSIQGIKINLGDGVILTTNLRKGGRYYGYATTDTDSDDEDVMRKHSNIKTAYNLYTIGLNDSSTTVRLDENSGVHVYNRYLEYLGTGSDVSQLPYSTKYYVSTQKLSESDGSTSGANLGDFVEEIPGLTTGTGSAENNYNPGTGR